MTATTIRVQMAQRKDTAANWTSANPILLSGEIGYETDTKKFKIGNGSSNWNALAYLPIPDGSGNLTITGNLEIGTTGSLTFEGSTADGFETTLAVTNPTADRTITLPDRSGTVITSGDTGTVTSTMLADGTIVNADVNASAAIAGTKISPDFGSQNVTTTGTATAASLIPTSSTVPTNGVYLPSANTVAISTNGTGRLFVDASGNISVGTANNNVFDQIAAARPLLIESSSSSTTIGGSSNAITISNSDATTSNTSQINFAALTGGNADQRTSAIISAIHGPRTANQYHTGTLVFLTSTATNSAPTEKLRIDSSGRLLVGTSSDSGGALLQVNGDRIRIGTAKTPASATDTGIAGEICWDASYVYVCTATNTWKRSVLSTW
jgi:hypothetical protein